MTPPFTHENPESLLYLRGPTWDVPKHPHFVISTSSLWPYSPPFSLHLLPQPHLLPCYPLGTPCPGECLAHSPTASRSFPDSVLPMLLCLTLSHSRYSVPCFDFSGLLSCQCIMLAQDRDFGLSYSVLCPQYLEWSLACDRESIISADKIMGTLWLYVKNY